MDIKFSLWGKYDKKTGEYHSLVYHMIDVGSVCQILWQSSLSDGIKTQLSALLQLDLEEACQFLMFCCALHDIGKATPAFQGQVMEIKPDVMKAGFPFPEQHPGSERIPHGDLTTWILKAILGEFSFSSDLTNVVARSVGGHHGGFSTNKVLNNLSPNHPAVMDSPNSIWHGARKVIIQDLMYLYRPQFLPAWKATQSEINQLGMILAGLCSISDWIGSRNEEFISTPMMLTDYAGLSSKWALESLSKLGWLGWKSSGMEFNFSNVFPFSPSPLQQQVIASAGQYSSPVMLILEAPMGIGKTEAALSVAESWIEKERMNGLYVGMPTQATSNQMYERVRTFLFRQYPGHKINLRLTHGQAQTLNEIYLSENSQESQEESKTLDAFSWFEPGKRCLLAPFGVGTIDQALFSTLQVKHFFVRMFGLNHKVIIFDEVHAYDMYMTELLVAVLRWLKACGSSVILLSATLPAEVRKKLAEVYLEEGQSLPTAAYPRVSLISTRRQECIPLPITESPLEVDLEWIASDPETLVTRLAHDLKEGGCGAVICNTVQRAQDIYLMLKAAPLMDNIELILFHARFPTERRQQIEKQVLDTFGKRTDRRGWAKLVIATQVIEQSLDLDFDLMITELAPVDLVLQRAGRLHRHRKTMRPALLKNPHLLIMLPEMDGELPKRKVSIYPDYLMRRSWLVLKQHQKINFGRDIEHLVEEVYDPLGESDDWSEELRIAIGEDLKEMQEKDQKELKEARARLIPPPEDEDFLSMRSQTLEENDPTVHAALRALTRLTEPTLSLVCLHSVTGGLAVHPNGKPVNVTRIKNKQDVFQLLQATVNVQHKGVIHDFLQTSDVQVFPPAWRKVAALRYHRLAVFKNGVCKLSDSSCQLLLDDEAGLIIKRREVS